MTIPHPSKTLVTLDDARQWDATRFLIQRKYDGEFSQIEVAGAVLIAEKMTGPKSGGFYTAADHALFARHASGWFAALSVAEVHGESVLGLSTRERWGILCSYAPHFPANVILADRVTFIQNCMESGAEGVCAHAWGDAWGNMHCHKTEQIYLCKVTATGSTQSVSIADATTGHARGNVKLGGGKCDQVRAGSIIRVAGMGLTDDGKIRQPSPCREWLVRV